MDNQTTYSAVLGSIISNRRKFLVKEQAEIAAKLGISQASYSRLESGKSSMSTDQIFLACNALQISPSELFKHVEKSIEALQSNSYQVIAQTRGSLESNAGKVVVGAALGALLVGILSKR
jgi:transcriptional regulator with XRE-family HTH domain